MMYFVLESPLRERMRKTAESYPTARDNYVLSMDSIGWGNGYAVVFKGHPLYGKHYYEDIEPIHVHRGLTFSGPVERLLHEVPKEYEKGWVFGFDTSHYEDTLQRWPKEAVLEEARELYIQLLDIHLKQIF